MEFTFEDLKNLMGSDFSDVTEARDEDVRNFWSRHIDTIYEFYIMPQILRVGPGDKVLEIGIEYYML